MRKKQIICIPLSRMSNDKKYVFDSRTLSYEVQQRPKSMRILKTLTLFAVSVLMAFIYFFIYIHVFGWDLPKTAALKKKNAAWISKIEVLNSRMDKYDEALESLQLRDDEIYRSIFGMNEIPEAIREAGFGGVNRYSHYDEVPSSKALKEVAVRLDVLTKKTYVQSKSFDEVAELSRRAGEMASCRPAIPPMNPDPDAYRFSSPFGFRTDPITGASKRHTGVDFAMPAGTPLYATGDGVVEAVRFDLFGYGNQVIIDHGFGYKSRYAHMREVSVAEGMKLKRGECIGTSGNSGRSTGPHLHYEVLYKGEYVNPANHFDLSMSVEEYASMTQNTADKSGRITLHPSHRNR